MNPVDVEHFVNGLLTGLVNENNFDELSKCMTNLPPAEDALNNIVADILAGKDLAHIVDAIANAGKLLEMLPSTLANCSHL